MIVFSVAGFDGSTGACAMGRTMLQFFSVLFFLIYLSWEPRANIRTGWVPDVNAAVIEYHGVTWVACLIYLSFPVPCHSARGSCSTSVRVTAEFTPPDHPYSIVCV